MSTLSQSLLSAAAKADAEAAEAIGDSDPQGAENALRRAAHFRRLAHNHRARAFYSGNPADDPQQIADPPSGMSGSELQSHRAALGLSREALARALDVTPVSVWRWEHDQSPIAHPAMLRLALETLAARMPVES